MKKTIACLVVMTLLSACSKEEKPTESPKTQEPVKVAQQPLPEELTPNGHWLFNPRHCSKELPSAGVFDIKVKEKSVTFIGITQSGDWDVFEPSDKTKALVQDFLASDASKCLGIKVESVKYARYTAPGTQFDFVLNDSKAVLLITQEGIVPALPFDEKILTTYKYVELNAPEEPIELLQQNPSNTDTPLTYTNN